MFIIKRKINVLCFKKIGYTSADVFPTIFMTFSNLFFLIIKFTKNTDHSLIHLSGIFGVLSALILTPFHSSRIKP